MITRLQIRPEKLLAALLYVADSIPADKYTVGKMLFLADYEHVARYGRPIVGGRYCAMPHGPVPSEALHLMDHVQKGIELDPAYWELQVDKAFTLGPEKTARVVPQTKPDLDELSESDIETLNRVIGEHGRKTFRELWDLTHSMEAYKRATEREPDSKNPDMDFEDFFVENPFAVEGNLSELKENYALARAFPHRVI